MQAGTGTVGTRTAMPALIAFGLVVVLAAGALVVRAVVSSRSAPPVTAGVEERAPGSKERVDWSFVANSPVVEVLAHRPGLRPIDVVRTHAFGWEGATLHEVTSQHRYLRILRMDPTLSPVDLVREVARGS